MLVSFTPASKYKVRRVSEAAGLICRSQVAGHSLQVIVSPIQKVSQTFLKANLRPKNFCLGLIRPKVSF